MLSFVRTLRFRLTVLYLVVFGVLLVSICVVVLAVREKELRESFDEGLIDRAEAIAGQVSSRNMVPLPSTAPTRRIERRLLPFRFPGFYVQLSGADGTILAKTRQLGEAVLPLSEGALESLITGEPVLETLRGPAVRSLVGGEGAVRVVTLPLPQRGAEALYLQVAASLERVHDSIAGLRGTVTLVSIGGLAIAGIAAWFLARRALAPIGRMADEAREYTAANLEGRLSTPPGADEVARLAGVLNEMLGRLEAAFRAQETFLANTAHELKTPVTVLLGEAQVLSQQTRSPEEYDRFVVSVQDEMRQLSQLVSSMLLLARTDAGLPMSGTESVSINEVVADAVARCQALAEQREVRLVPLLAMPRPDHPEAEATGDPELLRAAVVNLIRNAVRFSPPEESVEVEVVLRDTCATVGVRDRGPGIPPEFADRLYERFFSLPDHDGQAVGSGLGLSITAGVAKMHGGRVTAGNRPEGGSEFLLVLPLAADGGSRGLKESH